MADGQWYRNEFVAEYIRLTNLDDFVGLFCAVAPDQVLNIGLNRTREDRRFDRRERWLLHLGDVEIASLHGTRLAPGTAPSVSQLAPRLRKHPFNGCSPFVGYRVSSGEGGQQGRVSNASFPQLACFPPLPSSWQGLVVDNNHALRKARLFPCERRNFMPAMREASVGNLDPAQATELSLLVDLEARWENLRKTASLDPKVGSTTQDLQGKQRAYEAFRAKLVAYNKRYRPAHVPELLLNTPSRLGIWCRTMRDLYLQVEHDPQGHCPVHLLEKAYRWAERMGVRLNRDCVSRSTPPGTIRAAIRDLEALGQWCEDLARSAPPA